MKRKLAFIMAAIMLVTTPASVLASENMDVAVVSEDIISENDNAYVQETSAEEDYAEEVTDIPEASYEASGEAEAGSEDYDVIIEDGGLTEDSSADASVTTEYGDDDFIVSIEEVPTTYSEVTDLDDDNIVASGECGDNLTWVLDDAGTLTISGEGAMTDWTSYRDTPWYGNLNRIYSVVIEEGVTTVGDYAFDEAMELANVSLPDSLVSIGDRAFRDCDSLKSIEIPESVVSIGVCAFFMCGLRSIVIPKGITSIGNNAFGESSVKDVYYDGTVQEWARISMPISYADEGDYDPLIMATFHFGGESESVVAGGACGDDLIWKLDDSGLMTISGTGRMFDFGEDLTGVWNARRQNIFTLVVEEGATSIGDRAFWYLNSLIDVVIPDTVTEIGCYAFGNCDALIDFTIPSGVTEIQEYVFAYCDSLESVNIPDSVTSIGEGAFETCYSLENIDLPDGLTCIGNDAFGGCRSITEIDLPESVTYIGNYAFSNCTNLISIEIPNNVTYLGISAFSSCTELSSVKLSEGLISINSYTFMGCPRLTEIVIPDSIVEIDSYAFQNGSSLSEVTLTNNITGIGEGAFDGCTSLKDVYYSGSESEWKAINIATRNIPLTSADIHYAKSDPVQISGCDVTLSSTSFTYDGSAKTPSVAVEYGSTTLTEGTDYSVSYTNNVNAGTARVTVTGQGDYTGTYTTIFEIKTANPGLTASISKNSLKVGDTATITASGLGGITYSSRDSSIATVSSSGKVTAKGVGSTVITVETTDQENYHISVWSFPISVTKANQTVTAKVSSSSIVKGKTATITASGKGTITYSSNNKSVATVSSSGKITAKEAGTATITVKAAGNSSYNSASTTIKITVKPKATTLSSVKSSSSKKLTVKWKKVSGVSGYQIQYSTSKTFKSGNKTATVSGASKVSKTISKLKKGKTYYVRVRTYKKVSGTKYYSSWTSKKKVKVK